MNRPLLSVMMFGILFVAFVGCDDEERQRVSRSQAQVAETSRELVQADAKTRGEIVALQRDVEKGQADLGRQRDQLESDRRQYADHRTRDPIIANVLLDVGVILACLLPLVLCIVLVRSLRDPQETDSTLTEILVEEIAGDKPVLLPAVSRQAALGQEPSEECLTEIPRADSA